eukprot:scaffold7589_cov403-Prasinococcus_capsulatus_cf.AAC.2
MQWQARIRRRLSCLNPTPARVAGPPSRPPPCAGLHVAPPIARAQSKRLRLRSGGRFGRWGAHQGASGSGALAGRRATQRADCARGCAVAGDSVAAEGTSALPFRPPRGRAVAK